MRFSKLRLSVALLLLAVVPFVAVSRKYVWLYVTRKTDPPSSVAEATVLQVLRNEPSPTVPQRAFLGVADPPYQNQGHVSAKLDKPNGFQRRLERDISDTFGTTLYDLPETRDEILSASKILGPDSVTLLGPKATETAFKAEPLADFKIVHIAGPGSQALGYPMVDFASTYDVIVNFSGLG